NIDCLARQFRRLLAGQFDRVALCLKPLAPLFAWPPVLRQKHGVAIRAAERAAHIRIARPIKATPANVAGRFAEDRTGDDLLHSAQWSMVACTGVRIHPYTSKKLVKPLAGGRLFHEDRISLPLSPPTAKAGAKRKPPTAVWSSFAAGKT